MSTKTLTRYSVIPTQRRIFNYANVARGGEYHQFNANQSGVIPVPTTTEINLSDQNRNVLFSSNYTAGFDNVYDWVTVFNGLYLSASRNTSASNGNDSIGPADINSARLPIIVDAAGAVGDVYNICSNNPLKIPNSGITYFEKMGIFQPVNSDPGSTTFSFNVWNNGTATPFEQANWNIDTFGAGTANPSGITLDFTQNQTLVFEISNRNHGKLRVGFLVGNTVYFAHEFESNNELNVLPFGNLNLSIRDAVSRFATGFIRLVGLFDGTSGVTFNAATDTTSTPSAFLEYYDYSTVVYTVGSNIKMSERPFVADMGLNYITADVNGVLLLAVRPKNQLSGVNNKTVYGVDHFNVSTRTPNLDDEVLIDLWWNAGGANGATWQDLSYYSGLEVNFSSTGFNFTFAIRLGSIRVKGSTSKTFSIKDILNDYENSFSIKQTTFNGLPVSQEARGTISLLARAMPNNSTIDPVLVSASLTGGEVA